MKLFPLTAALLACAAMSVSELSALAQQPTPTTSATSATPGSAGSATGDKVIVLPAAKAKVPEEDAPPKLSLPTEADRAAWTRPGFRLELGFVYGRFHGLRGAPSGRLLGPIIRAGLRLDKDWSLIASFEYAQAKKGGGGLSGLRFAGTLDPTWHVTRELSVAVGFGFGGIVEGGASRGDVDPQPGTLETSYTFPDASKPLPACNGVGAATLVRGDYSYVIGPRGTFHIEAEAIGQWTGCVDDSGRVEPDTGQAIVRRQWWPHVGWTLNVGFMWR